MEHYKLLQYEFIQLNTIQLRYSFTQDLCQVNFTFLGGLFFSSGKFQNAFYLIVLEKYYTLSLELLTFNSSWSLADLCRYIVQAFWRHFLYYSWIVNLDTQPCAKGCFQSTPCDSGKNEICLYWLHEIKSVSKIPGTMSFEQSKLKWRCLAVIHSTTFGKTSTSRHSGGVVMLRACFAENCYANFCGTTLRSCVNECLRHWIKFWRRLSQNFSTRFLQNLSSRCERLYERQLLQVIAAKLLNHEVYFIFYMTSYNSS